MSVEGFSPLHEHYTEFWGLKIDTDSPEEHEERFGIHVVMACIDINEEMTWQDSNPPKAVLWLEKGNDSYQVCRLTQEWRQQPLNLIFERGLYVRFFVVGNASIYIYGYGIRNVYNDDQFIVNGKLSTPPSASKQDNSHLGKYSHIIDTTTYTISDGSIDDSSDDSKSKSSSVADKSNSEDEYTSESTPRSVSLGSSTSCESPAVKKKMSKKKNHERKD